MQSVVLRIIEYVITVCTIVPTVVRATRLVNGKPRFLDPHRSKTPEPNESKLVRCDYVGDLAPHANFGISILKGEATYA